jgi:hypothetical protein
MLSRRSALLLLAILLGVAALALPAAWRPPALAGAAGVALGLLAGRREEGGEGQEGGRGVDMPTERGALPQADPPRRRYRLVAWDGDRRVDHELAGRHCVIGRDPGCDLRLQSDRSAPLHARVTLAGDLVMIADLDSGSGTFLGLGGPRLPAHQPTEIQEGDEIWLGPEVRVALRYADAD